MRRSDEDKPLTMMEVYIPHPILVETIDILKARGAQGKECVVHWCGNIARSEKIIITSLIHPKQQSSIIGARVDHSEVAKIYQLLHEKKERLVAQIHTHPGSAFHSSTDDAYPIMYKPGLLSIVVPNFGSIGPNEFFVKSAFYEYQTQNKWNKLSLKEIRKRFKVTAFDFDEALFSRTKLVTAHLNVPLDNLLPKLKKCKVALVIDDVLLNTYKGQVMLSTSINFLTRCYIDFDVFLNSANTTTCDLLMLKGDLVEGITNLCRIIRPSSSVRFNPTSQGYDVGLIIGEETPIQAEQMIYIDANGWLSYVGSTNIEYVKEDIKNPIGSLISASLGTSEVFKALLNNIGENKFKPIKSMYFSALEYELNPMSCDNPPLPNKLDLNAHLIGAGAIGTAVAHTLASLPTGMGIINVIDPENVEASNLNRYSMADMIDIGKPKVDVVKERLEGKYKIVPFKGPYQSYETHDNLDLAVVTVDNVKTRRDVQLDFPNVILNAGMYGNSFTVSRHDDFLQKACLGCLYPIKSEVSPGQAYPAISYVSMFAGALLAGEILKEQIEPLRKYRLNNAFIVSDIFTTPIIGETFLVGEIYNKSDRCSCHCRRSDVIETYKKSRLKRLDND